MKFSFRLLFIGKQSWGDSIYDLFSVVACRMQLILTISS